jgi:hypothetical protein
MFLKIKRGSVTGLAGLFYAKEIRKATRKGGLSLIF